MDSTVHQNDLASADPTENKKIFLVNFLEKSRNYVDDVFQSWRTSGKTYMIPPDHVTVALDPGSNETSSSGKKAAMKQVNMKGDWAEAKVYNFLSKSKQHAFIMQNFNTSRWRRIFKTLLDSSNSFDDEIKEIANIEIDFLILHAFLGVVAIEVKSVGDFHKGTYTYSKKQLDKVDILLENVLKILASIEKQSNSIPVSKVVSFPNVKMKQDVKNPYNLGQINLQLQPELWWSNLLEENRNKHNKFVMDHIYHDAVIFLLGVYSIATSPKIKAKCIQNSKFFARPFEAQSLEISSPSRHWISLPRRPPSYVRSLPRKLVPSTPMSIEDMHPCSRLDPYSPGGSMRDTSMPMSTHNSNVEFSWRMIDVMELHASLYPSSLVPSSLPFCATTMDGTSNPFSLAPAENLFFLNFGQLQVINCQANKQLILGEARTGKTVVLQEKAFDLLMRGEAVSFVIPRNLHQVYQCFEGIVDHAGDSRIYYHETISLESFEKLRDSNVFIDDLQNFFPTTVNFLDQEQLPEDLRSHEQKFNCTIFEVMNFLGEVPKAVVACSPAYSLNFFMKHYLQQLLNTGFQLIQLHEQCVTEPN